MIFWEGWEADHPEEDSSTWMILMSAVVPYLERFIVYGDILAFITRKLDPQPIPADFDFPIRSHFQAFREMFDRMEGNPAIRDDNRE